MTTIAYNRNIFPSYICIKGISEKSDLEILKLLQVTSDIAQAYDKNELTAEDFDIFVSRDDQWVHIIDNSFWMLDESKEVKKSIEALGKRYDIYTCSVGDADLSFNFKYFKDGQLRREYVVESPNYNDEVIVVNFGDVLSGEIEGLHKKDQLEKVLFIAHSLGVNIPKDFESLTSYNLKTLN